MSESRKIAVKIIVEDNDRCSVDCPYLATGYLGTRPWRCSLFYADVDKGRVPACKQAEEHFWACVLPNGPKS